MGRKSRERMTGITEEERIKRAIRDRKLVQEINYLMRHDDKFREELTGLLKKSKGLSQEEVEKLLVDYRRAKKEVLG